MDENYKEAVRRIEECLEKGEESLDLESLGLTTIPKEIKKLSPQLKQIYFGNNQLDSLGGFPQFEKLEILYLNDNKLENLLGLPKLNELTNLSLFTIVR